MRIAVVHSFYSAAQPSGENVVVMEQVEALRRAGHEVCLVSRSTKQKSHGLDYAAAAATTVTGRGPSPAKSLRRFAPDVVHLHNTFPNFGTAWLSEWGNRSVATLHNFRAVCAAGTLFRDGHECYQCLSRPVLPAVLHGCYRQSSAGSIPLALASRPNGSLRQIGRRCAEVIALNEFASKLLSSAFDGRPIHVVPNFSAAVPAGHGRRSGWAYVGRLAPEKGIRELIAAWPNDEELSVFGSGPLEPEVNASAADKGRNISIRGMVSHQTMLEELGEFEGLIVPSQWAEGMPTVVLEALARGVPIVMSARIAAARDLEAAGAAVVVKPELTDDILASALQKVRADPLMSGRARGMHSRGYSEEAWLHAVEAIYSRVLEGVGGP